VAGAVCFFGATSLKRRFGYDDSLDAFGVHGIGGFVGSILTGVFAAKAAGGTEAIDIGRQVGVQILACAVTTAWSALATLALLKLADATLGVRVDGDQETVGLDLSHHEERGYDY
jgi:Amt family ammonium transporter